MTMTNVRSETESVARGFSRRHFARITSLLSAGAALPFYNEAALAQFATGRMGVPMPPDAVRIGSNENPLGPCKEALEAISKVAPFGGRSGAVEGGLYCPLRRFERSPAPHGLRIHLANEEPGDGRSGL